MSLPTPQSGPSFHFRIAKGSTKLVLYFSGTGMGDGKFSYWKISSTFRTHALLINNGRNHWYQGGVPGLGESVDQTVFNIRLWARKLRVKELYTVGQSMGAHGAILYGAKLGARVLAFGAETIVRLEGSRSTRLWQDNAPIVYPDLHDVIANAKRPIFAFAGERDPVDLYCMSKANGLPNYYPQSMIGVGHGMASYLHNRDKFIPMVQRFIDNHVPQRTRAFGAALEHPGFADAFYDQYCHMNAGRFAEAAEAGRLATSLYADADQAFYVTASALVALRQPAQALPYIERALAISPKLPDYRLLMARCLARTGSGDRAIPIYRELVAIQPDYARSHYELAALLFARGDYPEAREAVSRALQLSPDTAKFIDLRDKVDERLAVRSVPNRVYRSLVDAIKLRA